MAVDILSLYVQWLYLDCYGYFYIFTSTYKHHIWQIHWVVLVGIYQYARNYQTIPNCLSSMTIFTDYGRT